MKIYIVSKVTTITEKTKIQKNIQIKGDRDKPNRDHLLRDKLVMIVMVVMIRKVIKVIMIIMITIKIVIIIMIKVMVKISSQLTFILRI